MDLNSEVDSYSLDGWIQIPTKFRNENYEVGINVFCSVTRFTKSFLYQIEKNSLEININQKIPFAHIAKEIVVWAAIYEKTSKEAHARSTQIKFKIKEDAKVSFPKVLWTNFAEKHPPIRDLIWYIELEPIRDDDDENSFLLKTIELNESIKNFRKVFETKVDPLLNRYITSNFLMAYKLAFVFHAENIPDKNYVANQSYDNSYHSAVIRELAKLVDLDDHPWYKYAVLFQRDNGFMDIVNYHLDRIQGDNNE